MKLYHLINLRVKHLINIYGKMLHLPSRQTRKGPRGAGWESYMSKADMPEARRLVIIIENDRMGDATMASAAFPALRDYMDAVNNGYAGGGTFEFYDRADGTRMTVIAAGPGEGHALPYESRQGLFDGSPDLFKPVDAGVKRPRE